MWSWLRRSPAPKGFDAPPAPDGPLAVIGDVHGADGLLARLLDRLEDSDRQLVCVGDYVDRGDNSAAVIDLLRARQAAAPGRLVCLMGNHERMLLDFLDAPVQAGRRWLRYGGMQTLASFGVPPVPETAPETEWHLARERFADALGPGAEAWLRALPLTWQSGNVAVVHAAADPRLDITRQPEQTLLWGHADFATTPRRDGVWVVHGHTIMRQPQSAEGRISIDTGAYATGKLTAALIDPGSVAFETA